MVELYQAYIQNRKDMTEKGLERLIARAKRLSKGNVRVEKEMLDAAVRNNWKDIYLPECDGCSLRGKCAGFFASNKETHSKYIHKIELISNDI